jgi:hypothetical protein
MTDLFPQKRSKARPRRPTWPTSGPKVGNILCLEDLWASAQVGHRVPPDNTNFEQTFIVEPLENQEGMVCYFHEREQ